ncbi:hypothetical protein HNR23_004694 [Nocardiopsis mwathae]|uniref:Uncharacterized protein n=1 Tax=Nocardiopsis mwathae TaxID=1472723 RepID=A0A7X0D931_9ACTN|nr:hypothetical protein [Nocardiopsis mwathae]MBB6174634.1 hypothetical protein [Nocardiopsis mwathae]
MTTSRRPTLIVGKASEECERAGSTDHHLDGIARVTYSGGSLADAYAHGRALLRPFR